MSNSWSFWRSDQLSILASLKEIARLLLCIRNHQCKEEAQVQPLARRWYDNAHDSGVIGRHVRNSRAESRQLDHPLYPELNPVDWTLTPLTPMDVETAVAEPPSIEMEQLPPWARIIFGTPTQIRLAHR